MGFYLQDPGASDTTYLIEILVEKCQGATGGGASFAWATSRGVNLLLENEHFVDFLRQRNFDLVVGVDAVTDEKALASLVRLQAELTKFSVSVFLNTYKGPLFHPKVCWFRRGATGTLVTGSGNLTEGGLSRNWEAFTVTNLDKNDLDKLERQWKAWKSAYADDLLAPSDHAVIERAKKNAATKAYSKGTLGVGSAKKALGKKLPGNPPVAVAPPAATAQPRKATAAKASAVVSSGADVLVAEIPKASNRWNQANFDQGNYENYFGAKVGAQRFMFFRHVKTDGTIGDTETRPSVAVKSSNYRFELHAASGLSYPRAGRPIAIFLKQAARNFLYQLLMPGDAGHMEMDQLLSSHWIGPSGRVRRMRFDRSIVYTKWPSSPIWAVADAEPEEI